MTTPFTSSLASGSSSHFRSMDGANVGAVPTDLVTEYLRPPKRKERSHGTIVAPS